MPYASDFKKTEEKSKENENYLTNTENETELPVEIPSTSFTECLDEEIEADLTELRAHLQAIISGVLPGFYEFQQAGYNLLYPKRVDIDALQARVNTMQIPALIQPQQKLLKQATNAFLGRFRRFRKESDLHNNALEFIKFRLEVNKAGWDEPQNRDYRQALKHGNRLSGYLSGVLDLISLLNEKVEWQTPWETTRQTNYDVLLNELLPVNADAHNNQYAAQTRGNLTEKQPDNIKFNAIVDSVTLDERLAREALSTEIERLSAKLLSGITLTRNYAEKPDETGETRRIKRDIDFLCQVLQSVIPVVQYAGQQIQPEMYQPLRQKEARTTLETVTHELGKARNAVGQKMQGAKASVQTLSDKGNKNKHHIAHTVSGSTASDKNGDSHNINKAVFQVGIRLLDKIQQTTSDMHKAIQTSRPLQQAVSHYSELDEMLSGMPSNSILDAKLRAESGRWRQKAEESKKQLQQALGTITMLSDESMKQRYLSVLREELNAVTKPLATNTIIRDFDTQVKATVEGLSDVQKALGQALLRLSEHGQAGGKELDKQTVSWLQHLKSIKDNLKTGITQATGQSINNFSRQGMLARWMAEWSEAEKQRYLGTLSAEERAATEKHYDAVFFEVIQHYLPQLSKESDPQGERLLRRLRLEVGNAAKGNTLYPATMADILAGMKSREQAIRDWSERKLIRGAFLAVCLGGVKLLPNLAALPLRLPIKFALTGAKVAWGAHKGRQGIRGGEGDISDEIAEYAKQNYKTAAIKIVLSLPPGLATTLGIASIAWRVYEGGLEGAGEKIAEHIIGEAPWRGLDTGTRTVVEAYATTLLEAAITEEEITSATHSSPLQPQTEVMPLSDEHDPDADRPRVRRKRALANTAPPPSPQWHDNIPSDATLQSEHFDFDRDIRYQDFSGGQKKQTYLHGIQFVLLQIQNDERFPKHIRDNAYLARIGARLLVPVDIRGYKLNNTIFLPDSRGAKSGVLIRLDSDIPYYYVEEGKDLLENIKWAMPHNADKRQEHMFHTPYRTYPGSAIDFLGAVRSGSVSYDTYFNYKNPEPMDIASLSAKLADTMEADYKLKGQAITNKLLISRAIVGAHIPDPEVTATEAEYHLEITWDNLTPAEYLRSFSRPFSTLSGEMQLVTSSIKEETIQETELHVHQAEYIGSWVDVTVGAIVSFTPAGWVLNTAQSAADIAADLSEGKDPDPLAVAGLVVGCIPGERIAAKVGKFTRIGDKVVKYGVMLGNKAVDLAIVGRSIKTAVDTGEPLAIYQAFLASGMSAKSSYDIARSMSSQLKISRRMEESASLEELEALHNNTPEYSLSSTMPVRTFRVGSTTMLGRINNGEIEFSRNNGAVWERGSKLHLLAYRLQNAGGGGIRHRNNVSKEQASVVRSLIEKSKNKAVKALKNVKAKVKSSKKEDVENVNKAFEIFFGEKLELPEVMRLKESYIRTIEEQQDFLYKLKASDQIYYQGGYDMSSTPIIFQTTDSAAERVGLGKEPLIKAYVDSIVDTNQRLLYSKERFENFISTALIHESFHAVKKRTPDISYPILRGGSLDIASIVSLSEPLLRGRSVNDILKNRELLEKVFKDSPEFLPLLSDVEKNKKKLIEIIRDRLSTSDTRVWQNPDNISYMTTLISYIDDNKQLYDEFINKYNTWKKNMDMPLLWDFNGARAGKSMSLENTDIGKLKHGDISPLKERGLIAGSKTEDIDLTFDYIRNDNDIKMQTSEHFAIEEITRDNGKLHGVMETWKGGAITSRATDGTKPGLWGDKFTLNDNVNLIHVVNGRSGTVAVKIPLYRIQEGKPVVITAGRLSGCSMVYAVDDLYFYAYHFGQQVGDTGWLTSRDGVASLYDTHLKLTNKALDGFETGQAMSNNDLVDIFSKYKKSVITYYGKETSTSGNTRITKENINVGVLDYNQQKVETRNPRLGLSYALLAKDDGNIKVKVYSEDLLFEMGASGKFSKLSGEEFTLRE